MDITSLEDLRRAADAGDISAMTELGARLLVSGPVDAPEGIDLLAKAGQRGDVSALALSATVAAMGVTAEPNWPRALDILARAAALGSASAGGQLRLLSSAPAQEWPDLSWESLARRVDTEAWRAAPDRKALAEAPRIRLSEQFAPPAICDWLISRARGRMRPAMMYDGASKTEKVDPHRTCSDYQFDILNTDLVVLLVRDKISAATRLPTAAMEPPRVFHYALGEQIKAHYDRCGDEVAGYGGSGYQGDRIVTFLLYLNDDYDGGELAFPKTGFQRKGGKGDAIYFAHVDETGRQDPLSLHAGLKITRGEKWVLSQWIHDRPFGVAGA